MEIVPMFPWNPCPRCRGIRKRDVTSHRKGSGSPQLREIDIAELEYVPLPRSPLKWEVDQAGREKVPPAREPFEVRDANWTIESV
ncbi:MAG TPA: hypothetical protein VGL73_09470, partial [Caulobacteraceae bacterium]